MNYLSTTTIGKLCGCTRVWAWQKARDGEIPFKRLNKDGKHYRYEDSPKLRVWCAAIKADRRRARRPRPNRAAGVPTFQGIEMQWWLLMRQLGDSWTRWTKAQKAQCRKSLEPIIEFDRRLSR